MADYLVTGPKGNGKSLVTVGIAKEYLDKGYPVATNLDLYLPELMGSTKFKETRVFRIPDHPDRFSLDAIGIGNYSKDENKNGALIIDELGTSMNSRNFQKAGREEIIDYIIHSRKLGWDLYLIAQDISLIDKQIRETLEQVYYCRRLDKFNYPMVVRLLTLGLITLLPLPKIHLAMLRYGKKPDSPYITTKWYRGRHLYSAYDTYQVFRSSYPHGTHSMLPPWHSKGRYEIKFTKENILRLTKIYWKRFSKPFLFTIGLLTPLLGYATYYTMEKNDVTASTTKSDKKTTKIKDLLEKLKTANIVSYSAYPDSVPVYILKSNDTKITTTELVKLGFSYIPNTPCKVTLKVGKDEKIIICNPVDTE